MQIAIVDADQRGLEGQCPLQLGSVVDLHKDIQPQGQGQVVERYESGLIEGRDDQQNAVRTDGPGLIDLIGVDSKILAQHRE